MNSNKLRGHKKSRKSKRNQFKMLHQMNIHDNQEIHDVSNAIIQFGEMTSLDNMAYLRVKLTTYFDFVNKGESFTKKWMIVSINPYSLPGFMPTSGANAGVGDITTIFEQADFYCMPKFENFAKGTGYTTDNFVVLSGVPARASGIDRRINSADYDVGLFQPQRKTMEPDVHMTFRHLAHIDYLQLQRNQQQMSQMSTTTVPSANLLAFSMVDPITGGTMFAAQDIKIRCQLVLTYLTPLWMRGTTQMILVDATDPTIEDGTKTLVFTNQVIFPEVVGVKHVD